MKMTAMTVGSMLSFEKKQGQPPVYKDLEEVVNRRMLTTPDSLARDSAAIIMRRAIVDYQGGVVRNNVTYILQNVYTFLYSTTLVV